ncbi:MAG TPA: M20 family metallo-hydrolase [Pseudolabrys sp.]|jgi:hydantoinase/carbamoylase family amidase|nr:M20 family metallo-hydrolase [Pseudolabrys sp.]
MSVDREAPFGQRILLLADRLAAWSETPDGLTCTFLSPAHIAVANDIAALMAATGLVVTIDAAANVVGRRASRSPQAKTIIVGSHYDTVRNAGKYDGRLGILIALVIAEHLTQNNVDLHFDLEVIAFSEEEGVRFSTSYIGSSAVAGLFNPSLFDRRDDNGVSLADALRAAGHNPEAIVALARRREDLAGYLEVHIEQGPALLAESLPVGVVTEISGNSRFLVTVEGEAGHAGTVPMADRHDAAAAAAEIILMVEQRCRQPDLLGTVGWLSVPDGAINLIPGRCELSLDIRSGNDATRKSAVRNILTNIAGIAKRRGVTAANTEVLDAAAVPCSPRMQEAFAASIARAGYAVRRLPSGAGHDAVMFSGLTDIGMLFVRCGNGGVSHSPRESVDVRDVDVAARVLLDVLINFNPA